VVNKDFQTATHVLTLRPAPIYASLPTEIKTKRLKRTKTPAGCIFNPPPPRKMPQATYLVTANFAGPASKTEHAASFRRDRPRLKSRGLSYISHDSRGTASRTLLYTSPAGDLPPVAGPVRRPRTSTRQMMPNE